MTFNLKPEYPTTDFELQNGLRAAIQNEGTGLSLFVEGFAEPVAFLDYYYLLNHVEANLKTDTEPRPSAAGLIIYDTAHLTGDALAFARFEPQQTVVFFETGVTVVAHDPRHGTLYGYPQEAAGFEGRL